VVVCGTVTCLAAQAIATQNPGRWGLGTLQSKA
jgi:hypothetical protein